MFSDKSIYRYHRISGLVGGLFILLLTVTGSILVVDRQVDTLLNPAPAQVDPAGRRQPYNQLLSTVLQQYPGARLLRLSLGDSTKHETVRVDLMANGVRKWVDLNPYTGTVLGARNAEATLVRRVRELHENLLLEPVGGLVMGLAGICLLVSVLTGTWYYRRSLLSVFSIGVRWNKAPRIVYADLHKWLGVVALLFMLLMSVTGIFFHWEQIEREFGERPAPKTALVAPDRMAVDAALAGATATIGGFTPQQVDFPQQGDTTLVIRGNLPESIRLLGPYNVSAFMDARTGHFIGGLNARDAGLEYIAEHIFEELHFGRYGGWFSQILYILLAMATAVVTISGLFLWYLKK